MRNFNIISLFSLALFLISLWQIEICWWAIEVWDAPFYLFSLNKNVARDLWYFMAFLSWLLLFIQPTNSLLTNKEDLE